MSDPYVSLILPVCNSERYIHRLIDAILSYFKKQGYASEVIVVDDGSTDHTRDVLSHYGDQITVLATCFPGAESTDMPSTSRSSTSRSRRIST